MSPYKVLKVVRAKGNLGHYWSLEQHANDASHNFLLAFYTDAFSALTLSVGCQEEHPVCKNRVIRYWCGYLTAATCKLFAYGPADVTAGQKLGHLLPHLNPRLVLPFWYQLTQADVEKRPINRCSSILY